MRDPDFKGALGKLWRCKLPGPKLLKQYPAMSATLAHWLVHVPGAHPCWFDYVVSLIHLRPIAGVPPAVKKHPDAEYEIIMYALNPNKQLPDPDDGDNYAPHYLTPANLAEQFHGVTDENAVEITEQLCRCFIDGISSPDTDFLSRNQALIRNTIEHMVLGGHPGPERN